MNNVKSMALMLAAVVALGGLSACSQGGMNQGAEGGNTNTDQPVSQEFGKSYVKEIPDSEVKQKETEMTSPGIEDKGPAVGSQTPNPDDQKKEDEKTHAQ